MIFFALKQQMKMRFLNCFAALTLQNISAGIGPKILKLAAPNITKSLTYKLNQSILSWRFPDKEAGVISQFKDGFADDPNNYRLTSVLPTISKLVDKVVCFQFYDFLCQSKLLHGTQSGFRLKHSFQSALLQLTGSWLKAMENGNLTGILFLDFQKAFDVVNHKILLTKLKFYKCDELTISWFKSYLTNRYQKVKLGLAQSKMEKVLSGVPQLYIFLSLNSLIESR